MSFKPVLTLALVLFLALLLFVIGYAIFNPTPSVVIAPGPTSSTVEKL